MCLIKKHKLPKILPWKKWVYKIVLVKMWEKGVYRPPFYSSTQIVPYVPIKAKYPWHWGVFEKYIEGEGVHAYSNMKDAKEQVKDMRPRFPYYRFAILEAYIPRFTPYWTGRGGEIASSVLVVTDKEM